MSSLFSQFDWNSTFQIYSWLSVLMPMILIHKPVTVVYARFSTLVKKINLAMKELGSSVSSMRSYPILFSSLITFLMVLNVSSLVSYSFPVTAHLSVTLPIGFVLWLSFLLIGFYFKSVKSVKSLTPSKTPKMLMSFMVYIESVSLISRPLTLSVRLMANITAGHLIMGLISYLPVLSVAYLGLSMIFILEVLVSVIQAYVFMLLLTIYFQENV